MNKRNSRIELLRIIAMFLIVLCHFATHGFEVTPEMPFSTNKYLLNIYMMGGELGVNIFVMISAWFVVDLSYNYKRILLTVCQTLFYTFFFLLLFSTVLTPHKPFGIYEILVSCFPITFMHYWFVTDYILLILISPFLNKFISLVDELTYRKLIAFILFVIILLSGSIPNLIVGPINFDGLIWFVSLYLIIGYIKRYIDLSVISYKTNLKLFLLSYLILAGGTSLLNFIGHYFHVWHFADNLDCAAILGEQSNFFEFFAALQLTLAFIKMPPFNNRIVNLIASGTFGVYLFHENIFMRYYLWYSVFDNQSWYYSRFLIFFSIAVCIMVYLGGVAFDLFRKYTFEKYIFPLIDRIYFRIRVKIINVYTGLATRYYNMLLK